MKRIISALKNAALLHEKISCATGFAAVKQVRRAFVDEKVQSVKTRELLKMTINLQGRPRTVTVGYCIIVFSLSLTYLARQMYKSALKKFCCCWVGNESFFDARRTWYQMPNRFCVHEKNERPMLSFAFEMPTECLTAWKSCTERQLLIKYGASKR